MPQRYPRVVLLLHHGEYFGRVIRGIGQYLRQAQPWAIDRWWGDLAQALPQIARSKPDGMVLGHLSAALCRKIRRTRIPFVCAVIEPWVNAPKVGSDDAGAGALAAEHLIEKGFRQFGFFGYATVPFSTERERGFRGALAARGFEPSVLTVPMTFADVWRAHDQIEAWLSALPRPAGVMACNDEAAIRLLVISQRLGIRVPEDLAVIGADNSEVDCEFSYPPLSSVETGVERTGFTVAATLDRLMAGKAPPRGPIACAPLGVVERQSTNVLAVDDPDLAIAIRYIREHANRPLRVTDVLRQVPVSRTKLETRFRQILGRTPLQEIRRAHVERAKELLLHTDLSVTDIAYRSGCPHVATLSAIFRKTTGVTPAAYRHRCRATAAANHTPASRR